MILIQITDKRYYQHRNIKFFNEDAITLEIYNYVKKHKNVWRIDTTSIFSKPQTCHKKFSDSYTRDEFLEIYKKIFEK